MGNPFVEGLLLAIWIAIMCNAYVIHKDHQELLQQLHQIELKLSNGTI